MSWDVLFCAAAEPPPPVKEMPDDWQGDILGPLSEIREKISEVLPNTDWSDPTWGIYDGDGFSFEFSCGGSDPTDGFMVHVRGGGSAVSPLVEIANRYGWYMLDVSQGEWLHHSDDPERGWLNFQQYRDQVISDKGPED